MSRSISFWMLSLAACSVLGGLSWDTVRAAEPFPPASSLPRQGTLPNPLKMFNGAPVTTADQWRAERRPELKRLFQHYMYGVFPQPPGKLTVKVEYENAQAFSGKGMLRCLAVHYGPTATPPLQILLAVPNRRTAPAPVFVGLNFSGNHTVLPDEHIPLPAAWMPSHCKTCVKNKATAAGRGMETAVWSIEQTLERGYAVATAYCGDIDPDRNDFTDGVHPHFVSTGSATRSPQDWGTIAAWAWGVHRMVDYLVTDSAIDQTRIAVFGHSRLGKTALLAAAFDERIALTIPHQAGTGGTAPSRHKIGETVQRINTVFPHWFCDEFKNFNTEVEKLPFDQHCLVALCAPRPVLFSNAVEDQWADPSGQFRVLQEAEPVYRLLGSKGLAQQEFPPLGTLVDSPLGYYIRAGNHSTTPGDWKIFCDFADSRFRRKQP